MPRVEKWRLDSSKREFNNRLDYLDYLRARRRTRLADQRFARVRAAAFQSIHRDIHRASSWHEVSTLLMKHNRDFGLLIDDPNFEMLDCAIEAMHVGDTPSHSWSLSVRINMYFSPVETMRQREEKLRNRRIWLDMLDRFIEPPLNQYPATIAKILQRLKIIDNIRSMCRDYIDTRSTVAKRDFPEIAVMEKMKAPPEKALLY